MRQWEPLAALDVFLERVTKQNVDVVDYLHGLQDSSNSGLHKPRNRLMKQVSGLPQKA